MSSLRARIVVTLFLSIVCVVGIATAALFWLREGHEQKEQKDHAKLVSEEILVIAPFFRDDRKDKDLGVSPASGQPREPVVAESESAGYRGERAGRPRRR